MLAEKPTREGSGEADIVVYEDLEPQNSIDVGFWGPLDKR
jgi:hypothetical protein